MKHLIQTSVLLFITLFGKSVMAQNSINSSSGQAIMDGHVYEYTIGDMTLINTCKTSQLIVTQGFLQPHHVGATEAQLTQTSDIETLAKRYSVYPNPTHNTLYIDAHALVESSLHYKLLDAKGSIVLQGNWQQHEGFNKYNLNLQPYTTGTYFLNLSSETNDKITFNIQKLSN